MNIYSSIIGLLFMIACGNKTVTQEKIINSNEEQTRVENQTIQQEKDTLHSKQDHQEAEKITTVLLESGNWFEEQKLLWQRERINREDSIRGVLVDNAKNSGYFTDRMHQTIIANSGNRKYGEYYYGYNLGRLLKAFSSNDKEEIRKNISITGDSATYVTNYHNVLNDVPSNDEQYDWLMESSPENERWLFAVQLVKENGQWKIDQLGRKFTVYNK